MGWLEDKYCGANFHLVKFIRNGICKSWDKEHGKTEAPPNTGSDTPSTPASPSTPSSPSSPFPPSQQPSTPMPGPSSSPPPQSNDHNQPAPAPETNNNNADTNTSPRSSNDDTKSTNTLPDASANPSTSSQPFPSASTNTGNPFPNDTSNVSAQSAEQNAQTGSMTAVYIGIGIAAVMLWHYLSLWFGATQRASIYMREADMEAGATSMPIHETHNTAPAQLSDPFIFDASANMTAAGLDKLHGGAPLPRHDAAMPTAVYSPFAEDPLLASYTNPHYGQSETVSPGAGVAITTTTGVATHDSNHQDHYGHEFHNNGMSDDIFGEHIYGDVHPADLTKSGVVNVSDAGYCLESLRADSYMHAGTALHAADNHHHHQSQLNIGTYGSDAAYLDATEEFPHVPAVSADDLRLKTT
ncbi:hypothetical protein BDF19DRAFT_415042 [Syncephalis fuscata]|nr:hypothetical protein BDF19DRAFT_415042 [Syncephalis fuscata]